MNASLIRRRAVLAGTFGAFAVGAAACGSSEAGSSTTSSTTSTSAATTAATESPDLATLTSEVSDKFEQSSYTDPDTGLTVPYNLFVPEGYDESKTYPIILYIADSSLVGQDVTAPLSQYGALIWASDVEQAKHESLVLVPEYPEVILDDHGSFTMTDYVTLTPRLLQSVISQYSVDPARVYGTGQSMGCMTVMYLAAQDPDLFAAELFVSGQWDVTTLSGLTQEKFFFIAAGGDENATGGQTDVQGLLTSAGVPFQTATWDATWSASEFTEAAAELFAAGDDVNFATFETGTVLEVADSTSTSTAGSMTATATTAAMTAPSGGMTPPSGGMTPPSDGSAGGASSSEHMASFEPAYKIASLRDWLYEQTA